MAEREDIDISATNHSNGLVAQQASVFDTEVKIEPGINSVRPDNLESTEPAHTAAPIASHYSPIIPSRKTTVNSQGRKRKVPSMDSDSAVSGSEDESDNDSDYDDGDEAITYNPESQELPRIPTLHPAFKLAEQLAVDIVAPFKELIQSSGCEDDETRLLMREISACEDVRYGEAVKIGIVGDSGKSSLINSLLGCVSLTPQADDGEACTYVVQEFVPVPPKQKAPFAAEIYWKGRKMRESDLKSHIDSYYQFYRCKKEAIDDERGESEEVEARTAKEVFLALFQDKDEFADEESMKDYLSTVDPTDYGQVLSQMIKWTDQVIAKLGCDGEPLIIEASNLDALSENILPYTKTVTDYLVGSQLKCSPWSMVRLVKIGVRSPLLAAGVTIADLPGISDINRTRVKTTQAYLKSCDYLIIVADIKRAETDTATHSNLIDAHRRRRGKSVIMVCTRSDDIGAKQNIPMSPQEEEQAEYLKRQEMSTTAKLKEIGKNIRASRGDRDLVNSLSRKREKLTVKSKMYKARQTQERILIRNRKVSTGLKKKYLELTKDEYPLPVFCVSNKLYTAHLIGIPRDEPAILTVENTNIPRMVEYIYNLPATRKLAALEHHCQVTLCTLFCTVEMASTITKIQRKEHLERLILQSQQAALIEVDTIFSDFNQREVCALVSKLTNFEQPWIKRAAVKCGRWESFGAASHRALCRKYGIHKTKKLGPKDLNKELLMVVSDDAEVPFNSLINACEGLLATLDSTLETVLEKMRCTINEDQASTLTPVQAFFGNLRRRQTELQVRCMYAIRAMRKSLGTVKIDALQDSSDASYLATAMKKVYERAAAIGFRDCEKGVTIHRKRCDVLSNDICQPDGIFMFVKDQTMVHCEAVVETRRVALQKDIETIFASIQHDFSSICATDVEESPASKELQRKLRELVPKAREEFISPVKGYLEECRKVK
ncbi:hypothetical protein EJ05DRAFT_504546 [Pseudovirgaria hyperparasitica]|uniref:P-loop containing nucleoside triphosphate hydrolase protein n=1 Tax=Pseudovirgaria hyperparasitica TaxID=470096 RepID=A0A6A6VTD8_9PEZI|nr:uncharacterized protein EJ05DRAFT_504546 [Pseudovirgaria hyperparasitica]KAF2753948.1 hypothetical protein EJ05DRAFT_504546 [Pseudovirgaria hyperparasitica]